MQVAATQAPACILIFPGIIVVGFWLDVATTCRSEPGQAQRKRGELKLYVLQAPLSRSVTKTIRVFEAVKLPRLATLIHALFIWSTGFIRLKA